MSNKPKRPYRKITVVETAEGRAYFPCGSWGAGYILDAAQERRLEKWVARRRWFDDLKSFLIVYLTLKWLPHHPFFAILSGFAVSVTIDRGIDRFLLRHARKTKLSWNDALGSSTTGSLNRVAYLWLLVASGSIALLSLALAIRFPSLDASLFAASFALGFGWLVLRVRRLFRRGTLAS